MIQDGTKRKCAGGEHQVVFNSRQGWHHTDKSHWVDHPHKAAPRKYKRGKRNAGQVSQELEGLPRPS